MADTRTRLRRIFQAVFPDLAASEVDQASPETVDAWDSVRFVTLITLLEEEFGFDVDPDDFEGLASFQDIAAYIGARSG